jgi:osmoprotectant transport system substrate-binding protein
MKGVVAIVMAATVGGLAGCGASTQASRASVTSAAVTSTAARSTTVTSTAAASSAATALESAATTTAAAASIPGAVTITTPPVTDTTEYLPGTGKPTVLLGDMNTPEQFIIGALYLDALQAQGYHVDLSRNIGPTNVSEAAVAQGSLDIYPEYLNVYDTQVAGLDRRFRSLGMAFDAAQRYANAHQQTLLTPTPFSDTAGIAVLTSYAHAHHLHSLADLRRVERVLTLGSPQEFSNDPDGLPELERAYRFAPELTAPVNIGNQYDALRAGTLHAAYVQTTDWELSLPIYTALRDSAHVLGFGNVVPVVSEHALDTEGPAFANAINEVDALLTTQAIRGLVAELEKSTDPALAAADVAQEFLQGNDILPPPPWSTVTTTTTTPLSTTGTGPLSSPAG